MRRIVIVARTRMQHGRVCIGGHDLDRRYKSVRLLDRLGDHWPNNSRFQVGDTWKMRYIEKVSARPPHVEDVFVMEYEPSGKVPDLKSLILHFAKPWTGGPEILFDGTVRATEGGAPHIPVKARLPRCSTGYWIPDGDLECRMTGERARFLPVEEGPIKRLTWVGVQSPPERIEAGDLVRVSLSRKFSSETAPEGYYVQISGVIG